jgi:hypothetical protein
MLRSVICTGSPILENRIISLTYADAVLRMIFRLAFSYFIVNKQAFIENKMTYADLRLRVLY